MHRFPDIWPQNAGYPLSTPPIDFCANGLYCWCLPNVLVIGSLKDPRPGLVSPPQNPGDGAKFADFDCLKAWISLQYLHLSCTSYEGTSKLYRRPKCNHLGTPHLPTLQFPWEELKFRPNPVIRLECRFLVLFHCWEGDKTFWLGHYCEITVWILRFVASRNKKAAAQWAK